jgi:hypothetical protein
MFTILSKTGKDETINFDQRTDYFSEIGMLLSNISQIVPKGLITVFPTLELVDRFTTNWKRTNIFMRLNEIKTLCIESESLNESKKALKKYQDLHGSVQGAHLIVPIDGKLLDLLSVKDDLCRGIVVVGLPTNGSVEKQASVVNRLISQVVSHQNDFGVAILVDERYRQPKVHSLLSKWVTSHEVSTEYDNIVPKIKEFFTKANQTSIQTTMSTLQEYKDPFSELERNKPRLIGNDLPQYIKADTSNPLPRKFIPLNKERQHQMSQYVENEKFKAIERDQQGSIEPVPIGQAVSLDALLGNDEDKEIDLLMKSNQRLKPNPLPTISASQGSASKNRGEARDQSDELEMSVTYVPNTDKLRTRDNTITRAEILEGRDKRSRIMCNICYEADKKFLVSKCGHISCEDCWETRLKELMECPICKQKVRRKTLIEIVS